VRRLGAPAKAFEFGAILGDVAARNDSGVDSDLTIYLIHICSDASGFPE
jgi:hypothetical protein